MPRARTLLLLLLCAATAGESAIQLDRARAGRAPGYHLLYLPSGRYLRAITFGYSGLAADLIYIWSIQYYSNYQIADRYEYLDQIYRRVIAELDPNYIDPYLVGSMIMSVEANRDDLALRLLDDGISRNPREWILPFEAGFLCYDRLRDYDRARAYFEKAVQIPGAPSVAKRLYAEMFNRLGDKRTSLRYWSQIHDAADSEYVRHVSWLHVHDLMIDVDLENLTRALEEFRRRNGAPAARLQAIVQDGILPALPRDPEGRDYLYDPRSGQVRCQSRQLLGRR